MRKLNIKELTKRKKGEIISSKEALKDIEPFFSERELSELRENTEKNSFYLKPTNH